MGAENERSLDEKGRITLPKPLRERIGIEPGDRVSVDVEGDRIVVEPQGTVSREEFIDTMEGCLSRETRASDAPDVDPTDLKDEWTEDLPN